MQSDATYGDAYQYLSAYSPALADLVDQGCRAGRTIDAVLVEARGLSWDTPAAKARWLAGIDLVRTKMRQYGWGLCTWADPRNATSAPMAQSLEEMAARVRVAGATAIPANALPPAGGPRPPGSACRVQNADGSFSSGVLDIYGNCVPMNPPPPQWPAPAPAPQWPAPHHHGGVDPSCSFDVLEGGVRCGTPQIEGGHCGKKCGGGCDSCLRPNRVCMWDAVDVSPTALSQACSQPGRWNSETIDSDLSICEIDEIRRTERVWNIVGTTANGIAYPVTPDKAHKVPAGFTMYAIELAPVRLSHYVCLRQVITSYVAAGGGAAVSVDPQMVFLEVEKIWQDGDGNFVHAWTYPKPEDEQYIEIKDGRCACAQLCDCVPQRSRVRVLALVPTIPVGAVFSMTARGKRECWGAMCGPTPPSAICNRTPLAPHVCVDLPADAAGLIAMIAADEVALGYGVAELLDAGIAAADGLGITPGTVASFLADGPPAPWKAGLLNPLVALYASMGWTALQFGAALTAAGGTLDEDTWTALLIQGAISGSQYANGLTNAPLGVRANALNPLIANYAANGWSAVDIANAITLAGGTLDEDVVLEVMTSGSITGPQYAAALTAAPVGVRAAALDPLIAAYAANGWNQQDISDAIELAGGTLTFDVFAQSMAANYLTGTEYANTLVNAPAGVKSGALTALMGFYASYGWTAGAIAAAIVAAGGTLAADVKAALP